MFEFDGPSAGGNIGKACGHDFLHHLGESGLEANKAKGFGLAVVVSAWFRKRDSMAFFQ